MTKFINKIYGKAKFSYLSDNATVGDKLLIEIRNKKVEASIVKLPFISI
jgi:hypothetical protein